MSKNLKKKALAFGSMFGLVVSGVVSMPAAALDGEVELNPESGSNYGVFLNDTFYLEADIRNGNGLYDVDGSYDLTSAVTLEVTEIGGDDFTIEGYISSADANRFQQIILREEIAEKVIDVSDDAEYVGDPEGALGFDYPLQGDFEGFGAIAYDSSGTQVGNTYYIYDDTDLENDWDADLGVLDTDDVDGTWYVDEEDFTLVAADQARIDRVVVFGILDFDFNLDYAITQNQNTVGDGDVAVKTRAWVENSGNPKTVETAYASAQETITFYDPAGTTVIPRIERGLFTSDALLDSAGPLSFSLKFSDPVNLDQIDESYWWVELYEDNQLIYDEFLNSGAPGNVTFIDYLNVHDEYDDGDRLFGFFGTSLKPSSTYRVTANYDDTNSLTTFTSSAFKAPSTASKADVIEVTVTPTSSALQETDFVDVASLRSGTKAITYSGQLYQWDDDEAEYSAVARAGVPMLAVVTLTNVETDTTTLTASGLTLDADMPEGIISGFSDSKGQFNVTVTSSAAEADDSYTVQFYTLVDRSLEVVFSIWADLEGGDQGAFDEIFDAYSNDDFEGFAFYDNDSDGNFEANDSVVVTVNGTSYYVYDGSDLVVADEIGAGDEEFLVPLNLTEWMEDNTSAYYESYSDENSGNAIVSATYEDAVVDAIEAVNDVVASSSVSLVFDVTDQFGEAISSFDGDALSVRLLSTTDPDDVEEYKAVGADGTVTFTFTNYLTAPDTDTLTATVGFGLNDDDFETTVEADATALVVNEVVSLYSPINVSSIITDTTLSTYVAYSDFITGKASATNVAPTDASVEIAGTVAGADNGGLPGAQVVIKGTGLQFFNGTTYSIGETTVVADVDGRFSVTAWTHSANATGQEVTITAGNVTQKVTLTSALPDMLDGGNLSFSWTLPAAVVKNTTYAVTLKLTDKWGNPLNTSGSTTKAVTVTAAGSLEVNGVDVITRNFGSNGTAVVYIRSVKDIAGPGSLGATLNGAATYASVDADGDAASFDLDNLGAITTDVKGTVWNETTWSAELETDIQVLDSAPVSADAKVNAGSFNGYIAVYAKGYKGATLSWKIAGKWFKTTVTDDYQVFQRRTAAVGVPVIVELYVNGVKQLTKTVTTR